MGSKNKISFPGDEALNLIAERFKALSEPSRLKLLVSLSNGEKTVGELVSETGLTQANVSRHLNILTKVGILARRKDGLNAFYHICDECIPQLCDVMCRSMRKQVMSSVKFFG